MLNLGSYFLYVVGAYKIYAEFVPWKFFQNHHLFDLTLYIYLCILLTSLSDGVIFIHYNSFQVYMIIGDVSPPLNPVQEINEHAYFT